MAFLIAEAELLGAQIFDDSQFDGFLSISIHHFPVNSFLSIRKRKKGLEKE